MQLPSIVMWMDIKYYDNYTKRISAYGCECGYVELLLVDVKTLGILKSYSIVYGNTIASVKIFTMEPTLKTIDSNKTDFQFLIVNTNFPSVVCM